MTIFRLKFVFSLYRNFRRGEHSEIQKVSGIRNFSEEMKGSALFSVDYFPHCTEAFRWGTILCFRKVLVSKNVRDKREG